MLTGDVRLRRRRSGAPRRGRSRWCLIDGRALDTVSSVLAHLHLLSCRGRCWCVHHVLDVERLQGSGPQPSRVSLSLRQARSLLDDQQTLAMPAQHGQQHTRLAWRQQL